MNPVRWSQKYKLSNINQATWTQRYKPSNTKVALTSYYQLSTSNLASLLTDQQALSRLTTWQCQASAGHYSSSNTFSKGVRNRKKLHLFHLFQLTYSGNLSLIFISLLLALSSAKRLKSSLSLKSAQSFESKPFANPSNLFSWKVFSFFFVAKNYC